MTNRPNLTEEEKEHYNKVAMTIINQTNDGYYMSAVMDARDIEILELKRNNDLLIKELSDIKNELETQQKYSFHFKGTLGQLEELKNSGLIP